MREGIKRAFDKFNVEYMVEAEFDAAHRVSFIPTCSRTHGHTWRLTVFFEAFEFVDLLVLKRIVKETAKAFDHRNLGDITSEELGARIYDVLVEKLKAAGLHNVDITCIKLAESCNSAVLMYPWSMLRLEKEGEQECTTQS